MIAPCPFCASAHTEIVEVDLGKWMVECRRCHTTGPLDTSPRLAEGRWNDRQLYLGIWRKFKGYGFPKPSGRLSS